MKKLLFLLLNLGLIQISIAQDYKNSLNIGFGIATPLGEFGSKDVNKSTSGAALQAFVSTFNLKVYIKTILVFLVVLIINLMHLIMT